MSSKYIPASPYKYIDQTFQVVQTGPGRYDVTLDGHNGYMGVNLAGHDRLAYAWTTALSDTVPHGIERPEREASTLNYALDTLCGELTDKAERQRMHTQFDPKAVQDNLQTELRQILFANQPQTDTSSRRS